MAKSKDEFVESGSGSEHIEGGSGNEQEADQLQPPAKKKRYHRHTARQIQEMESYGLISYINPIIIYLINMSSYIK